MDSENIQAQEQEVTQQGKSDMEAFLETFDDDSIKRAFKETLNDAGEFDRNKVKNLAGRMISDRRALSKIKNMPESVEKFKENYKPNDKFAPLFDESNEKGAKIRDMFNKLDELCYSNTIGEDKNSVIKNFLLDTFASNGIIDAKSAEEKEAEKQKKADDIKEILQDSLGSNTDLDKVQSVIDQFIEDESDGDETTKAVFDAINNSAKGKLILYSLRNRIYGKPVPVMKTEIGNSLKALQKEYDDPNTTRERRKELAEKMNEMEGLE
jgi:hypothetical protein